MLVIQAFGEVTGKGQSGVFVAPQQRINGPAVYAWLYKVYGYSMNPFL